MIRVVGGKRLSGEVHVGCAKNAVLPILAAALLTDGKVTLHGCPKLVDVSNMLLILKTLGCKITAMEDAIVLDSSCANRYEMPEHLSKQLRSSIFMMGPLLGRFRRASVTYPGGCDIGQRPIDLHLKGLKALGVTIREEHGMIHCDGSALKGGEVQLDFPSVGATENVMMAAVLAKGRTTIHNAAREPEIRDLQNFINTLGGRISGGGTGKIIIDGVDSLSGGSYTPIPDRIVAGTLLVSAAVTGGDITLHGVRARDMGAALDKLRQTGCELSVSGEDIHIAAAARLRPFEVSTQPYPGFPTDLQAQFMAMACVADGASVIIENLFENRFSQAAQLRRMGADIFINDRLAVIRGKKLYGARVRACDLRGGAAMMIAALAAEGVTEIENEGLIDRGYEGLDITLNMLGADTCRDVPFKLPDGLNALDAN